MWINQFFRDIKGGFRYLTKNPGFSVIAVLSLALGIMATTAIYSVIHAVVLDPFPYKDVDSLTSVRVRDVSGRGGRTYYPVEHYIEIAERSKIFDGVIASTISDVLWIGSGDPQRLRGNIGPFNTFDVMGVPPLIGRTPSADDAKTGATPVVVLGYKFWQRQFAGDRNVLGMQMKLNDQVRTVIGVMPKRFMWRGADVYIPVNFERGRTIEGVRTVHVLGRLKPGITETQAEVDLTPIIQDLKQKDPGTYPETWRVGLLSFKETFPSSIRENLWILFGAVGLLLLIACANVSNLLLSKAGLRQKEMAVRAAIGANRSRLIRQLLTESLILAVAGGLLGIALAYGALRAILAIVPPDTIPDESEVVMNTPVLVFSVAVTALTSLVFGLTPALHTIGRDLANPLRESGRSMAGNRRQTFLRKGLVVAEVALSLMLLVGAGLMIRTFQAVQDVDLGFKPERVLTMRVPLPEKRYPETEKRVAFFEDLTSRLKAVPGVNAVGLNNGFHPFGGMGAAVQVIGTSDDDKRAVLIHQTNADYFKSLGIELRQGRAYDGSEVASKRHLAVVNETFQRTRLSGAEAIGKVVKVPRLKDPPFGLEDYSFEVVGVVKDIQNDGITDPLMPEVYIPYSVAGRADRLALLTQGDPASVTRSVLETVYSVDKDQPVTDIRTMQSALKDFVYAGPRFNFVLFALFAVLGLALAVIGVYGVMSSAVAQQTHEIGVRMALGASPGSITGMVIKRGGLLLLIGLGLGLIGSLAAARLLETQIWNVKPFDPVTFGAVSLILLIAGIQACLWPAMRASRVDPLSALRQE